MKKKYTLKQIEDAMKEIYGAEASIEIIMPVALSLDGQNIYPISEFDDQIIMILNKSSKDVYCPLKTTKDLVKEAIEKGNIVLLLPNETTDELIRKDKTSFDYSNVCFAFPELPHIIPKVKVDTVYHAELSEEYLKNKLKKYPEIQDFLDIMNEEDSMKN